MDELIPQRLLEQKMKQDYQRPNTAVAYVRVSDEAQIEGESLDTQKARIIRYASDNEIEIIKWFGDEGKSGKNVDGRASMLEMLIYCKKNKGKIGYTLFYKMQRASRDAPSYYSQIKPVFEGLGMAVRSATEHIDDSPVGRFVEGILVLNGQLDNEIKSGTVTDNMRSVARQGWWQHGLLVGYDLEKVHMGQKKTHTRLRRNRQAKDVAELFEAFAQGGLTQVDIMRMAKEKGVKNANGRYLNNNAIYRMLTQPAYAGYICSKFTNYEMCVGQHITQALVSLETFQLVQQRIRGKSRAKIKVSIKSADATYPLKRFLLCFNCSKPFYASSPKTGGGLSHSPRYHCTRPTCKGKVPSISVKLANEKFMSLLEEMQPVESTLKLYKEVLNRTALTQLENLNRILSSLRTQLTMLDEERAIAMRRWNKSEMTTAEKDEILSTIDVDKLEKIDHIRDLENKQAIKQAQVDYAMNFMHDASKLWADGDLRIKQGFQKLIFPEGVVLNTRTMQFGTSNISPMYRYIPNKKELSESENSLLVSHVDQNWKPLLEGLEQISLAVEEHILSEEDCDV